MILRMTRLKNEFGSPMRFGMIFKQLLGRLSLIIYWVLFKDVIYHLASNVHTACSIVSSHMIDIAKPSVHDLPS